MKRKKRRKKKAAQNHDVRERLKTKLVEALELARRLDDGPDKENILLWLRLMLGTAAGFGQAINRSEYRRQELAAAEDSVVSSAHGRD